MTEHSTVCNSRDKAWVPTLWDSMHNPNFLKLFPMEKCLQLTLRLLHLLSVRVDNEPHRLFFIRVMRWLLMFIFVFFILIHIFSLLSIECRWQGLNFLGTAKNSVKNYFISSMESSCLSRCSFFSSIFETSFGRSAMFAISSESLIEIEENDDTMADCVSSSSLDPPTKHL